MKLKQFASMLGLLLTVIFAGCGGGGGGGGGGAAVQFALTASKANVLADGTDTAQITATFISPVPNGTVVNFAVTSGTATLDKTSATTVDNKATVSVKSSTAGTVTVKGSSAGIEATTTVTFNTGIAVNTTSPTVPPNTPTTVTVSTNSPNTTLTVTTDNATAPSTVTTDANGTATIPITSNGLGSASVTVTNPTNQSSGTVTVSTTVQITVAADKTSAIANGSDPVTVTADFTTAGVTVADGETVTFSASNGAVLSSSTATTSGGKASVTVKSSSAGSVVVTASYKGSTGSSQPITFTQAQFAVSPSKNIALADNSDAITIKANFQAPNGTPVAFSVVSGTATLSAATANTVDGVATVTVKSATPGQVTIKADAGGSNTANATVKFISQPTSMVVTVAMTPPITSLGALQFTMVSDATATYNGDFTALNAAAGAGQFTFASLDTQDKKNVNIGVINGSTTGFDTLATPLFQLSYAISSGLPGVQVRPTGIVASQGNGSSISLTPANFSVVVKYNTDTF